MSSSPEPVLIYRPPDVIEYPGKWLVADGIDGPAGVFLFFDRIEIGRFSEKKQELVGHLGVRDPTVSSRHCVITQEPDGRCFVRDVSRNGTRLDGRRLTPNMTTEITVGQELSFGREMKLRLDGQPPEFADLEEPSTETFGVGELTTVTVLVGDIRNYTTLVRIAGTADLQTSVNRVFERIEREVVALGGTVKELQGDALFAFWEKNSHECHACSACQAALNLKQLVAKLAADPAVWNVGGHPLAMDFALATGLVTISGYGSDGALGLSMVGESVVLAYRIEKFANKSTGPIVVCPITKRLAKDHFKFKDLGEHTPEGFETTQQLFSLVKAKR